MLLESLSHTIKQPFQSREATTAPRKPDLTPEERRAHLATKLQSLKQPWEEGLQEYDQASQDGIFEDQAGEPAGAGEARKNTMQQKLTALKERALKLKRILDSKEPLPPPSEDIQTSYTYTNPQTNTVEYQETITLDIEQKLQEFISFYQTTHIDLPPDFADTIQEIWDRNYDDLQEAIEQQGFNDLLLIPGSIPLLELKDKMTMEQGYFEGNNFKAGGSFAGAKSEHVDRPRMLLVHKATLPEISQHTGLDVHLNITGKDVAELYQQHPTHFLSTLEDFLILERKHFADTGEHLSDWQKNSAHWLPGTKLGARLVYAGRLLGSHRLYVDANDPGFQNDLLGVRPSRCFF